MAYSRILTDDAPSWVKGITDRIRYGESVSKADIARYHAFFKGGMELSGLPLTSKEIQQLVPLVRRTQWDYSLHKYGDRALKGIYKTTRRVGWEISNKLKTVGSATCFTRKRLYAFANTIEQLAVSAEAQVTGQIVGATSEAGMLSYAKHNDILSFGGRIPNFNTVTLSAAQLRSMSVKMPIGGHQLNTWVKRSLSGSLQGVVKGEMMAGLMMGEDYRTLCKRFDNTGLPIIERNVENLTRSYIQSVNTQAAMDVAKANSDFVKGWKWNSICENRTCIRCLSLDSKNKTYPLNGGPTLPAHVSCYDDETEAYTNNGWKFFKNLKKDDLVLSLNPDTFNLEWSPYIHKISYRYKGKMIFLHNRWFSLIVTPEHNQLFGRRKSATNRKKITWEIKPLNEVMQYSGFRIPRTGHWEGKSPKTIDINGLNIDTELFCKFMGYWLSEGSVTKRSENHSQISIAQNPGEPLDKIYRDIKDLPVKLYKGRDKIGSSNKELSGYLFQFGHCHEKFVPAEIKNLCPSLIKTFLMAFIFGDGSVQTCEWKEKGLRSKHYTIVTSSRRLADDLGELILKVGGYPSFSLDETAGKTVKIKNSYYKLNHDLWRLSWNRTKVAYFDGKVQKAARIKEVDYDGMVYDIELLKNHVFWVRHRGKTCFSGNCRCMPEFITKTFRELGVDVDEIGEAYRPYTIRGKVDPISGKIVQSKIGVGGAKTVTVGRFLGDYNKFFEGLPEAVQLKMLGPTRHKLYMADMVKLSDLTDRNGKLRLLKELQ